MLCYRRYANDMQNSFLATSIQKNRRRRFGLAKRTEFGLRDHVSDAFHTAEVHDTFRSFAIRLQRPFVHLRWRTRGRRTQGMINNNILYSPVDERSIRVLLVVSMTILVF